MGKYKGDKKLEDGQHYAQDEVRQARLFDTEEISTEAPKEDYRKGSYQKRQSQEPLMKSPEWIRRSSLTDWLLALFTGLLVACMISQIRIMDSQLDSARKDQRPWLQPTMGAKVPGDKDTSVAIQVGVNNAGKTPAKTIDVKFFVEVVKNGDSPQMAETSKLGEMTTGILYPSSAQFETVNYDLLESQMDDYRSGRSFLVMYSTASYIDQYKTSHWTKTCAFASPKPGGFSAEKCTSYNDADNN